MKNKRKSRLDEPLSYLIIALFLLLIWAAMTTCSASEEVKPVSPATERLAEMSDIRCLYGFSSKAIGYMGYSRSQNKFLYSADQRNWTEKRIPYAWFERIQAKERKIVGVKR